MKVLVTGGAGFIGKHLVRSLLEKGNSVTIFDNFSNSAKDSVSSLVEMGAKIIEGDITKSGDIQNAAKDQDVVIHLAAKISVPESISNPAETFFVNVDGTKNVLAACEKNHVKKLIAASSAAVYGEGSPDVKLTEESRTEPISPYGQSKVQMEQVIRESKRDVCCIILRFFNIYGIGQSSEYAGVITKFMEGITQKRPLEIFGDGMQTRDFISIHDVVKAFECALKSENGTFNIASGKSLSINELAKIMFDVFGKVEIKHLEKQKGDIQNSVVDVSLAESELDFTAKRLLKEELTNIYHE